MISGTPRPLVATALVLLLGCGPKSNLFGDSGSTSQGTTSDLSSTGDPTTTTTTTTTTTAPNPTTTGPTPTTSPSSSSSATTDTGPLPLDIGTPPFCGDFSCDEDEWAACSCMQDCGGCPLPVGVTFGCPAVWSGGSAVSGMTPFGPFDGHTAFFGWEGIGDSSWSELRLFVYDATVDLEAAKNNPYSNTFFALQLSPPWNQPEWLNKGIVDGALVRDEKFSPHQARLEITSTAGNWQQSDPMDPPRLLGTIHPAALDDPQAVEGPFDAAFCHSFLNQVIPE